MNMFGHNPARRPGSPREILPPEIAQLYVGRPFDEHAFLQGIEVRNSSDLRHYLYSSLSQENLLGQGANASVFALTEVPDIVVRVPRRFSHVHTSPNELQVLDDPFPVLNLGQSVARFGALLLLKRVTGDPYSTREHCLAQAAALPLESYATFAQLLAALSKQFVRFDSSDSANLLIDQSAKLFRPVDLRFYSKATFPGPSVAQDLIQVLLGTREKESSPDLLALRERVLEKAIEGALRGGLTIGPELTGVRGVFHQLGKDWDSHPLVGLMNRLS